MLEGAYLRQITELSEKNCILQLKVRELELKLKKEKKMTFIKARETMAKAMKDSGTHQAYKANISMCIYDNRRKDGRLNINECNEVADKLITLIFDS